VMVAVQTSVGEYDAEIFLERYGCDGPVAKKVFKNINEAFATFQPNVG